MDKLLSISVAAFNSEKWIERCLDSFIIPEVIDEIEILIVNDGSTDRTDSIARKYSETYPNTFRLINKENGGHGSTINIAIMAAKGKYFKIVDSDDWVDKQGLITLVNQLRTVTVDAVCSTYYVVNADTYSKAQVFCVKKLSDSQFNKILTLNDIDVEKNFEMHALTFYTEILKKHFTPIDEKCFYVDLEYIAFYLDYVETILFSEVPVYCYLIGTNEQSINLNNKVKNRVQHLRVCKTLIKFYLNNSINPKNINRIILESIINEYRILLKIGNYYTSKYELMAFDSFLKKTSSKLYQESIHNGIQLKKETALIIWFLRKIRFHGYRVIHQILKKI